MTKVLWPGCGHEMTKDNIRTYSSHGVKRVRCKKCFNKTQRLGEARRLNSWYDKKAEAIREHLKAGNIPTRTTIIGWLKGKARRPKGAKS